MTTCMKFGCEETAQYYKKTEGFSYDDYRCEEHTSNEHIMIENAPQSIQRIHQESLQS